MSAPVNDVKAAVAQAIAANTGSDPYVISVRAFEAVYGRPYNGKPDRPELQRIMYHAKRMMSGNAPGAWGGRREGGGSNKQKRQEVSE